MQNHFPNSSRALVCGLLAAVVGLGVVAERASGAEAAERKFLYAAVPGVRNELQYGGHGVLVFDIENGHRFVKRIAAAGLDEQGKPLNVKGVCACAATRRLYVSTLRFLTCFDLVTEKILWEKRFEGGCDRMAIAPDGKFIYLPSLERDHWHVVAGATGRSSRPFRCCRGRTTRLWDWTGRTRIWRGCGRRGCG